MTGSRSTLDGEADDEPQEDTRETCFFWDSRAGGCGWEGNVPGHGPCADCPEDSPEADAAMTALYRQLHDEDLPDDPPFDVEAGLRDLTARIRREHPEAP